MFITIYIYLEACAIPYVILCSFATITVVINSLFSLRRISATLILLISVYLL